MAFGMKHWLGLVVAGCAIVALEELPPRPPQWSSRPTPPAAMQRLQAIGADVQRTHGLLLRLRWSDSISAVLAPASGGSVAVDGPPQLSDSARVRSTLAGIRKRAEDEMSTLGPPAKGMVFGYFVKVYAPLRTGNILTPPLRGPGPEILAGTAGGTPYCARLGLISQWMLNKGAYAQTNFLVPYGTGSGHDLIGACRPFLRFGLPGPRIAEWLKRGAIAFAEVRPLPQPPFPTARDFSSYLTPRTAWRGLPTGWLELDACVAGRQAACLRMALDGPQERDAPGTDPSDASARFVTERSPFYRVGNSHVTSAFGYPGGHLFADLEREFGPDAFRRFWTSDQDVPAAFRSAFGVDMGAWVTRWVRTNVYAYRAGPSLPRSAAIGGFLLFVLCGVAAGAVARRRSVG